MGGASIALRIKRPSPWPRSASGYERGLPSSFAPGRRGAVKDRSQFVGPGGHYVKRDSNTGRILNVKADQAPFKGVRKEK